MATLRLTVVDDHGFPVEGAKGRAGFWRINPEHSTSDEALTDERGFVELSGMCSYDARFSVEKEGYYRTSGYHIFSGREKQQEETLTYRRWVPAEERIMVLKKIRNPIPMFSHRVLSKPIPRAETPLGFDLRLADWVAPYGEGEVADVTFTVHLGERTAMGKTFQAATQVVMTFPNEHDGVQSYPFDKGSEFHSMYTADSTKPFQRQLVFTPTKENDWYPQFTYLVFRTRSRTNASGELISCHYGKIYPTITFSQSEFSIGSIVFNPTVNDTNLEFDPTLNLTPLADLNYRASSTRPSGEP